MIDLQSYATTDYQKRGKNSAKSGEPVAISANTNRLSFNFENTSEKDAKKFVNKFCKKIGHCDLDVDNEAGEVTVYAVFSGRM